MSPPGRSRFLFAFASSLTLFAVLWIVFGRPYSPGPRAGGLEVLGELARGALSPAWTYERAVPSGSPPLWFVALTATWRTLVFATAAMSLALPAGLVLGVLGARSFWDTHGLSPNAPGARLAFGAARATILALRSVHELIWAVLFLAAFGLATITGVLAIALPFAGALAKVFSELLDETEPHSARALAAAGLPRSRSFLFGLLPRALPDLGAYAFYRYECGLRASAVLGFFGYPTLGYHLRQALDNLHYRELWTYLYALIALVVLFEGWSALLRKRFVA